MQLTSPVFMSSNKFKKTPRNRNDNSSTVLKTTQIYTFRHITAGTKIDPSTDFESDSKINTWM